MVMIGILIMDMAVMVMVAMVNMIVVAMRMSVHEKSRERANGRDVG